MAEERSELQHTIRIRTFAPVDLQWFTISLQDKTCDCPHFRTKDGCEHLSAIGIHRLKPFTPTIRPTFSQALSALVKSLRIRRLEEAVYWLIYLHSFKEPAYRFRTARRLLIGSAEDGHSVAVMEKVAASFWRLSKPRAELIDLVAEAVRIWKLPNWWHPDSGGPDLIYQSLIGQRAWRYKRWDHTVKTLQNEIQQAIEEGNRAMAVGGVMAFNDVQETFGATQQAEFLLQLAESRGHDLAGRLCRIHLSAKSALSNDNNFLCQAAWMMAGGVSSVVEKILPVTTAECAELLERARECWKDPHLIPKWCLDGVHSAGDDPRFMGCLPEMWAVCKAFQFYGRVDPADEWLPEFRCFDGLVIEDANGGRG